MKIFINNIISVLVFISFSCENIDVADTKLEFKEKIVVRAELISDSTFAGVLFTRTLPVDEQYDLTKAEIKDAVSYLKINGVQIVPLHYSGNGLYKPLYDLKFFSGSTVELFGHVKGKSVYSKTLIPESSAINNTMREGKYILASVSPKPDEVYGARWLVYSSGNNNLIDAAGEFHSIIGQVNYNSFENIIVRTSDIPENYLSVPYIDRTFIEVYSFDKAYLEYYKSSSNNQIVNNTFTQGGGAVAWNVFGEDVIGLFVGISKGNRIKVN